MEKNLKNVLPNLIRVYRFLKSMKPTLKIYGVQIDEWSVKRRSQWLVFLVFVLLFIVKFIFFILFGLCLRSSYTSYFTCVWYWVVLRTFTCMCKHVLVCFLCGLYLKIPSDSHKQGENMKIFTGVKFPLKDNRICYHQTYLW